MGRLDSPYVAEVIRMHEVIAEWTTGAAPNDDEWYARFANALAPGFMIINPDGVAEDRESIVSRFRDLHGSRAGRNFQIQILEPAVHRASDDVTLVRYHEHWFERTDERSVILATALLLPAPDAPGKLAWRHLHETWLRASVSP